MNTAYHRIKSIKILALVGSLVWMLPSPNVRAERAITKIVCRAELAVKRRQEMSEQLRSITGWSGLHFDDEGVLRIGEAVASGGSPTARALLVSAQAGKNLVILEDASGRDDVVFCRVVNGRWRNDERRMPPVFVVQIDFKDFSHVQGDKAALSAFNAGWGVLHELDHVVRDSIDPDGPGAAGECEDLINQMRRECGLVERAEYFYSFLPGSEGSAFKTRFVRLAFERALTQDKRRRYWLMWDAEMVGGLPSKNQVAVR